MSLFDAAPVDEQGRPLAERMRPERLEDFVGQEHILGPGKPLRAQIESDRLTSIILWGPPGVGKTTLAKLVAHHTKAQFIPFSAVLSGMTVSYTHLDVYKRQSPARTTRCSRRSAGPRRAEA